MIETEQTERLISLYYTETPSQIQRMLIYFSLGRSTEPHFSVEFKVFV
ncbi:unnamed protein product, partial [Prunus brigantina]